MKLTVKAKLHELGQSIDDLTNEQIEEIQARVEELALLTYQKIHELAAQRLHGTRSMYIDALKYTKESPSSHLITLGSEAVHLDDGYAGFNMLPKLAQGPASRQELDKNGEPTGNRYVIIPFRHTKSPVNPDNAAQVQMAQALRQATSARQQGNWLTYRSYTNVANRKLQTYERHKSAGDIHPHLDGLIRVREFLPGKGKPTSSGYMTFRVASTKKPFKFVHPGFIGVKIFTEVETWVKTQFDKMVRESLGV